MAEYLLCGSCIQPKNSLRFKLLAFWRKLDKIQKNSSFFRETFPKPDNYISRNLAHYIITEVESHNNRPFTTQIGFQSPGIFVSGELPQERTVDQIKFKTRLSKLCGF